MIQHFLTSIRKVSSASYRRCADSNRCSYAASLCPMRHEQQPKKTWISLLSITILLEFFSFKNISLNGLLYLCKTLYLKASELPQILKKSDSVPFRSVPFPVIYCPMFKHTYAVKCRIGQTYELCNVNLFILFMITQFLS